MLNHLTNKWYTSLVTVHCYLVHTIASLCLAHMLGSIVGRFTDELVSVCLHFVCCLVALLVRVMRTQGFKWWNTLVVLT